MPQHSYYTAVGHYQCRSTAAGDRYPVVIRNDKVYEVDPQEMTLWSCLSWRLMESRQLERGYHRLERALLPAPRRDFETCLYRLLHRGLIAAGTGETALDALYDLFTGLYPIPVPQRLPLRLAAFFSLFLTQGAPLPDAVRVFRRDKPSQQERLVLDLSRQAVLSVPELIKCVEHQVSDVSTESKLLSALYGDRETTSDNLGFTMRQARSMEPVTIAVANLYLRKQLIFEQV